ncbi:hypothetical protein [Devosia aquimaris]|uniref:hypothetical protein n=1 Tax=Devosia aquimaris TaxID=2866214 RepID=UPI001CD10E80|nr:hypothetical protein [Devosia sp. CJK-A8-3]
MNVAQITRLAEIETAITKFIAANAAIPNTATDDVMDAALEAASDALSAVAATRSNSLEAVDRKLKFATTLDSLGGWDDMTAELRAECRHEAVALELFGVRRAA